MKTAFTYSVYKFANGRMSYVGNYFKSGMAGIYARDLYCSTPGSEVFVVWIPLRSVTESYSPRVFQVRGLRSDWKNTSLKQVSVLQFIGFVQ